MGTWFDNAASVSEAERNVVPLHTPSGAILATETPVELQEINEQLLISVLREQSLSDQLGQQIAFSSAIMESLAEGVCAVDKTGHFTFANKAAQRQLGWTEADLLHRNAGTVLYGVAAQTTESPLVDVLRTGATYRNDHAVFVHHDGTSFPVICSFAPIVVTGQVVGAVIAFDDVSELQRLQQAQQDYFTLMSHDLRTPLTTLLGNAELLVRQLERQNLEGATRNAEALLSSSSRLADMLQDVLAHSQLNDSRLALHLTSVDLGPLFVRNIEENMSSEDRARIRIDRSAYVSIVGDPARLERVIVNLLSNACKYSAPTSLVVVQGSHTDTEAIISVIDQGVGISADDLPRVFEKHFRAGTVGTIEGTGLGLYGSRLIVEAHGGQMWVQSVLGGGSTFTFSLPLNPPQVMM